MFTSSSAGLPEKKAGRRTPIRLGTALIAAVGLLLGPLALAASATTTPHATTPVQGSYVPVTPFRITDTRTSSGAPNAGMTLAAAGTLNVQVTGLGTVPAGASAAVLNVTAVDPTASGFLTVFPEGTTMPLVSSLNFTPGVNVANLVTVPLSSAGGVSIYNSAGSTNVVVDAEGYYTSTPSINGSGLYNAISPVRALGTLQHGATVAANTSVPVTVTGTLIGVPATATAVVANVTAAFGTASSFLTVYPAGVTMPTASNLNFVADQVVASFIEAHVALGIAANKILRTDGGRKLLDLVLLAGILMPKNDLSVHGLILLSQEQLRFAPQQIRRGEALRGTSQLLVCRNANSFGDTHHIPRIHVVSTKKTEG